MYSTSFSPVLSALVEQRKNGRRRRADAGMPESGESTATSAAVEVFRRRLLARYAYPGQDEAPGNSARAAGYASRGIMGRTSAGRPGQVLGAAIHVDRPFTGKRNLPSTVCHRPLYPVMLYCIAGGTMVLHLHANGDVSFAMDTRLRFTCAWGSGSLPTRPGSLPL